MSGICGIIHWDSEPVSLANLSTMADAANYRGPDGIRYYIKDNVGMAHLAMHTLPESSLEKQPITTRDQTLILVGDVRIDNRDDIIQRLGGINENQYEVYELKLDAYILLAAYQKWQEKCLDYIYGDFSFVVWDAVNHCLFAAVDQHSIKGLHYSYSKKSLFFSTEAHQILSQPGISHQINELQIARDLVQPRGSGTEKSYFENINRVPPAHYLKADVYKIEIKSYWDVTIPDPIRYKNQQDYNEHFLEIFTDCVKANLRNQQMVSILLSGGLDSSSIFAIAAQLAQQKSDILIEALSFHVASRPEITETSLSRQTAQMWGKVHNLVKLDNVPLLPKTPAHLIHPDSAVTIPWVSFFYQARCENPSNRVWLTGVDGDSKNGVGNVLYYLELISQGKILPLINKVYRDKTQYQVSWKWLLWDFMFERLFLHPLSFSLRPYRQKWLDNLQKHKGLISSELIKKADISNWIKFLPDMTEIPSFSSMRNHQELSVDFRRRLLLNPTIAGTNFNFDRIGGKIGIEFRHPWNNIRLIEFFLSVPQNIICQGLDRKVLIQSAMKGLLPDSVRNPSGFKTGPEKWLSEAIKHPETQDVLEDLKKKSLLLKTGWIYNDRWESYVNSIQSGQKHITVSTWYPITLSIWLSNLNTSATQNNT